MDLKDSPFLTEVSITLGGQEYTLCFPLTAVWKLEEVTGLDILSGELTPEKFQAMTTAARTKLIAKLCYAGLITKHPEITLEKVASMISLRNLKQVDAKSWEAFRASLPQPEGIEEETADPTLPAAVN